MKHPEDLKRGQYRQYTEEFGNPSGGQMQFSEIDVKEN